MTLPLPKGPLLEVRFDPRGLSEVKQFAVGQMVKAELAAQFHAEVDARG